MKAAALLALLLVLGLLQAVRAEAAAPFDPFKETAIDSRRDAGVPTGLHFRDEAGRGVTLAELSAGKPMLLVPVLHDCPNICGVTLEGLAQAIEAQHFRAGSDFVLVAFGIDPRETPDSAARSLARLAKAFPALVRGGGVHALTGDETSIHAVTDALGYRYAFNPEIDQYAHLAATAVLTPDGRLARWLFGLAPQPTDLRLALTEAGQGKVGGVADRLLLLCYHYDPVTGRYGALIWTMLRVGGCGTALALGSLMAFALIRERRGMERARQGRQLDAGEAGS
ncbi:MAG: SCO family protein [Methylobacterium mesophilicum]|nr:SCO family protein [Methylobacterium mesophilicum]